MKRLGYKFLFVMTLTCIANFLYSQSSCLPGNNPFTQSDIDNFSTNYPTCTNILGSIVLDNSDVSNLNGLIQLTKVTGEVFIRFSDDLGSLDGLDNLDSIGFLYLLYNSSLNDISALYDIVYAEQGISVIGLPVASISGFNNITEFEGSINIIDNSMLTSVTGFSNLTEIAQWLDIGSNPLLSNLQGFQNLEKIGNNLFFSANPQFRIILV